MNKILLICSQPFFEWRGSPIRVSFNLTALKESSFEVFFLCLPHGQEKNTDGIRIIRCFKIPFVQRLPIGPSIPKLLYDIIHFFYGVLLLLREKDIKIIHAVEDSGIPAVLLAKLFGKKLVFEKHSDPASHKTGKFINNLILDVYKWLESHIIKNADLVIGTGDQLVMQATEINTRTNAIAIPDIPSSILECSDCEAREIRRRFQFGKKHIVATYVGSFAVYQGIDLLFETIPMAIAENPHLYFLIIGGNKEQIEERKQSLQKQGVSANVVFAGMVDPDELPAYLKASDILLSPRVSGRNSPLKILDYLKAKRPIIATDIEANTQILCHNSAILVQPKPLSMARALGTLAEKPLLRKRLAQAGKKILGAKHNYSYFKSQIAKGYSSIICP